jgi:hypothetical protein
MKSTRILICAALMLPLASCVQYYHQPAPGTTATATLVNTSSGHDAFKASVFKVEKINGKLSTESPMKTPYGGGPVVRMGESKVMIAANQPAVVELYAYDHFAAEGAGLFYAIGGKISKSASETITFTPKANAVYVVKGQLGKESSSVWLEDQATGKHVK